MIRIQIGIPTANCSKKKGAVLCSVVNHTTNASNKPVPNPHNRACPSFRRVKPTAAQSFVSLAQTRGKAIPLTTTRRKTAGTKRLKTLRPQKATRAMSASANGFRFFSCGICSFKCGWLLIFRLLSTCAQSPQRMQPYCLSLLNGESPVQCVRPPYWLIGDIISV